jgi:NADPH-dependent 7-cyano-7-deazaguanine reductase QueF-like protein
MYHLHTLIYTCLTSIPRFALREKVALRLLKLPFKGMDVVKWSRVLEFIIQSQEIKYIIQTSRSK